MIQEHTDLTTKLLDSVLSAQSAGHLAEILWEVSDFLGASGAVFTSFNRDDDSRESYKFVVACPASWCMEYNQNAWFMSDPCLLYAIANSEPALIQHLVGKTVGQKRMIAAAKQAGFVSGLVIPAHSPAGRSRIGVMYVGSADAQHLNEAALRKHRMLLRSLSCELLDWFVREEKKVLVPQVDLKPKEIEMLQMSHRGFTSIEIASTMHLTKDAVSQSIFRAARKLGTSSRKSAANIAYRLGLFQ